MYKQLLFLIGAAAGLHGCGGEEERQRADLPVVQESFWRAPEKVCDQVAERNGLENRLSGLSSDSDKADAIGEYIKHVGFNGWVAATGGPTLPGDCIGDDIPPFVDEQARWAIDFYKQGKAYLKAVEVAEYASLAHRRGPSRAKREIYLEGARDERLSLSDRAWYYAHAGELGKDSFEENVAVVREAVPVFIQAGCAQDGKEFVRKLLPDEVDHSVRGHLTIPEPIRLERERLLRDLDHGEKKYKQRPFGIYPLSTGGAW